MPPRSRWLILGFALLGLVFSGGAAYVHYRLLTEPSYVSPCDINATFSCSDLYLSRFGSFHGVSIALGGVFWFVTVLLIGALSRARAAGSEDASGAYIFGLSTVALAVILYLGYASFYVLRHVCLLCLGTYAAVIGIFIVSGTAASVSVMRLPGRLVRDVRNVVGDPLRLLITLLFIVGATFAIAYFPKEGALAASSPPTPTSPVNATARANFESAWSAQPRVALGIPADGAKVVVVKFNDWQCPSCKLSYFSYKPVLDKYAETMPGAIKYVTKDYPLNNRCNFNVSRVIHPGACEAAAAVRIASAHGKADAMIDWLFSNQETFTPDIVKAQVQRLVGVSDFDREYARLLPDIQRDAADGGALQIQYTPTYYINGVKAQVAEGGWLPADYFDYAIQFELKKAGGN